MSRREVVVTILAALIGAVATIPLQRHLEIDAERG